MSKEQKENYPSLPVKHWWLLREKFKNSIPTSLTPGYVATALSMKESSAKANVIPALIKLGIISEDGKPKDRAVKWRDDEHYAEACNEILKEIYPAELREALPPPNPARDSITRWFGNKTKVGANGALKMAIMYETLCNAKVSNPEDVLTKTKTDKMKIPKIKSESKRKENKTGSVSNQGNINASEQNIDTGKIFNPSVHIDIQVHISPEATAEQIDKIFSSMSKHIFIKRPNTDE